MWMFWHFNVLFFKFLKLWERQQEHDFQGDTQNNFHLIATLHFISAVAMYVCYLLLNNVIVSLAWLKKSGVFNFTFFAACATSLGQYFPLKNKKKTH